MSKMEDLKGLGKKHGLTAALVGGALVIGSNYGACTIDLSEDGAEAPVPAEADDAAPEEGDDATEE
jgi:hypothetical protein|tara:strand:+ start:666 stop:863 length:198 start_codon:yes stop_codon:yes gene_type:complete